MRVYEKVRAYINEMGYTQAAVAEKAGIPKAAFNAILNGRRVLYADDLKAICLALNVSPELFIEGLTAADKNKRTGETDCEIKEIDNEIK